MLTHYYIYYYKNGSYFYDRTLPTEYYAKQRVEYMLKHYKYEHAVYVINNLIKDAFY